MIPTTFVACVLTATAAIANILTINELADYPQHYYSIAPAVIAALISAAASVGTKAYSNAKARKAGDKAMAYQRQKEQELQNWYDRNYNEDVTQRADAQAALTYVAEMMKQRNKAAQGRQAVMGGTEESVAAEKERNNKAYAEVVSNIAAAGAKRKDAIQDQYLKTKLGQLDTMSSLEMGRAGNLQQAGNALAGGIDYNSIANAFEKDGEGGNAESGNDNDNGQNVGDNDNEQYNDYLNRNNIV